jgi:hypothetical protein
MFETRHVRKKCSEIAEDASTSRIFSNQPVWLIFDISAGGVRGNLSLPLAALKSV